MKKQQIEDRKIFVLEDFIPGLVYKLNNHLAPIIGYGQLLLPKGGDRESKRYVEKIIDEAQQASEMIKELVNFVKRRRPKKEFVDLNHLIETVLEKKTPILNLKNIEVVKELSASIPRTLIDVRQIEQALINLIANAEEAILEFHGIGKIEIKTRVVEGQIEIVIKDDGPGISKKNLPRIFDPFFTTKAKGTGLGLTVSYDIIAEHGGVLRVESEWGKGTFFIITLPIIEVQDGKQNEVRIEKSLKGTKGLVIDDEPSFLDSVLKYLRLEGSEVVPAVDAKTALNIIESKDFDFVICDIKMPGISGPDFYRIIREKRLFLCDRIIFMTGDLLSDTTRAFLDSVTNPNIEKPFNLDELKEIIVKMLEKNR